MSHKRNRGCGCGRRYCGHPTLHPHPRGCMLPFSSVSSKLLETQKSKFIFEAPCFCLPWHSIAQAKRSHLYFGNYAIQDSRNLGLGVPALKSNLLPALNGAHIPACSAGTNRRCFAQSCSPERMSTPTYTPRLPIHPLTSEPW